MWFGLCVLPSGMARARQGTPPRYAVMRSCVHSVAQLKSQGPLEVLTFVCRATVQQDSSIMAASW